MKAKTEIKNESTETKTENKPQATQPLVKINETGAFEFNNHLELATSAKLNMQLKLIPTHLIDAGIEACMAAMMFCKQNNLPTTAMNELGWIEGRLTCYGSLYWTMISRHEDFGDHEMFWLDESQEKICVEKKNLNAKVWAAVIRCKKKGSAIWNEYYFTIDEAKLAGLYPPQKNEYKNNQKTGNKITNEHSPWWKYTKDMLMHKVKKRMGDANYASAINGVIYHEDAYEALSDGRDVTPNVGQSDANEIHEAFKKDQGGENEKTA